MEAYLDNLINSLPPFSYRVIQNEEENKNNFKIEHAKLVIKESYIASSSEKYIILIANKYEIEAQNKLLKILEEPPHNIIFIIITTSKSNLLNTIISRLPHKYIKSNQKKDIKSYDLLNKDLKQMYLFLKENQRISKDEVYNIIQSLLYDIHNLSIRLSDTQLNLFTKSLKLLELNSRPINILTYVVLNVLNIHKEKN
jgi:DNA polymerase-3 subunit delta'